MSQKDFIISKSFVISLLIACIFGFMLWCSAVRSKNISNLDFSNKSMNLASFPSPKEVPSSSSAELATNDASRQINGLNIKSESSSAKTSISDTSSDLESTKKAADSNTTTTSNTDDSSTTSLLSPEQKVLLEQTYDKGVSALMSHKYQEAISFANVVIQQDKNNYKAYSVKGIALCYLGNYAIGMENIDKALSLDPTFAYGRFNKALGYELFQNYDNALIWYDKALEIENFPWSHYGKASIYGRRGDAANAVKCLKAAIEIDPAIKNHIAHESDFENIRQNPIFKEFITN